ncbi:MAG TPA: Smr/MutS family protein [Kofleriaceae bacterium]|nr:Smr/MutS family protein [Kofleriaceae bacterium]
MGQAVRRDADEASELFREAVRDATPLVDRHRVRVAGPAGSGPRPRPPEAPPTSAGLRADGSGARAFGVSRKTMRELSAGRLPPEASLDLHRLTSQAARERLVRFVGESRTAGLRVVLVITGKAERPTSRVGERLRDLVPGWLGGPLATIVLAYTPARARDGGAGALYVLLRSSSP